VLVVEDERNIRELVCLHLGSGGLRLRGLANGQEPLARAERERFDLLVLDLMIPGSTACRCAVRSGRGGPNQDVPILMLTARRDESDKVSGSKAAPTIT
jgi:DNA-binding response OmpR family regulator